MFKYLKLVGGMGDCQSEGRGERKHKKRELREKREVREEER